MPSYSGTVTTAHSAADAWHYLADLSSVSEWDPSIENARLVAGTPGEIGTGFVIDVSFLGRRVSLPYRTVEASEPDRLVFEAETKLVSIRDTALVAALPDGGATVTWEAELRPRGLLRLADPLLAIAFRRIGRDAEQGLTRRLQEPQLASPVRRAAA